MHNLWLELLDAPSYSYMAGEKINGCIKFRLDNGQMEFKRAELILEEKVKSIS